MEKTSLIVNMVKFSVSIYGMSPQGQSFVSDIMGKSSGLRTYALSCAGSR